MLFAIFHQTLTLKYVRLCKSCLLDITIRTSPKNLHHFSQAYYMNIRSLYVSKKKMSTTVSLMVYLFFLNAIKFYILYIFMLYIYIIYVYILYILYIMIYLKCIM